MISLFLAQHTRKVYGILTVPEAIAYAKRTAEINGIMNVELRRRRRRS
ncbi:hypothetical protein [Paenibacillus sp. MBLB4367]